MSKKWQENPGAKLDSRKPNNRRKHHLSDEVKKIIIKDLEKTLLSNELSEMDYNQLYSLHSVSQAKTPQGKEPLNAFDLPSMESIMTVPVPAQNRALEENVLKMSAKDFNDKDYRVIPQKILNLAIPKSVEEDQTFMKRMDREISMEISKSYDENRNDLHNEFGGRIANSEVNDKTIRLNRSSTNLTAETETQTVSNKHSNAAENQITGNAHIPAGSGSEEHHQTIRRARFRQLHIATRSAN